MSDNRCTNPGGDNYFTCPACYADHLGYLEGTTTTCECGATLRFTVEQQPVAVAEIVEETGHE
jgi:hypothetical protein